MNSFVISFVRTAVPGFVAWILAWLTSIGIEIPADKADGLVSGLTFVIMAAYYLLARTLESKFPQFGWMLGAPVKPVYPSPKNDVFVISPPGAFEIAPTGETEKIENLSKESSKDE